MHSDMHSWYTLKAVDWKSAAKLSGISLKDIQLRTKLDECKN